MSYKLSYISQQEFIPIFKASLLDIIFKTFSDLHLEALNFPSKLEENSIDVFSSSQVRAKPKREN